jgi:hypothetical protein
LRLRGAGTGRNIFEPGTLFSRNIYIIILRSKVIKKAQNSGNQGFSCYFSGSVSVQIMTDPSGPKTYGTYGSGSPTLYTVI